MADPDTSPAARLQRGALRPAHLVRTICQMILGAGLAVTLVLKVYMAALTDHQCVADAVSLGNTLRCTPTLALMAYVLALSAGFDLAYRLFIESLDQAITPAILGLGAALLAVLSSSGAEALGWREALVIIALTVSIGGLIWVRNRLVANK